MLNHRFNCKCCNKAITNEYLEKADSHYDNVLVNLSVCSDCYDKHVYVVENCGSLVICQRNNDGSIKRTWVDENGNPAYVYEDGEVYHLSDYKGEDYDHSKDPFSVINALQNSGFLVMLLDDHTRLLVGLISKNLSADEIIHALARHNITAEVSQLKPVSYSNFGGNFHEYIF